MPIISKIMLGVSPLPSSKPRYFVGDRVAGPPPDTTPPILSSPSATKTGTSTANVSVVTNESGGTLYFILTVNSGVPTAAQISSGHDATGAVAKYAGFVVSPVVGTVFSSATGLAASTTYYTFFVQYDSAGNISNVVGAAAITTDAVLGIGWDAATSTTALSNFNLTSSFNIVNGVSRVAAANAHTSGKYYFEITWAVMGGYINGGSIGVGLTTATYGDIASGTNSVVVAQGNALGWGQIHAGGAWTGYHISPFNMGAGDVVGIAVDLDNKKVWFRISPSGLWNGDSAANPVTNVNGVTVPTGSIIPVGYFNTNGDTYIANFGGSAFSGSVPSGYTSGWPSGGGAGTGWNTLPLGAGGFATGMHIANDGTMVCRTDVGNIYRWSGLNTDYADPTKKWVPLLTNASLNGAVGGIANRGSNDMGGWEHVLAPGSSNVHVAIFGDFSGSIYGTRLWYSTNSGSTWNTTNISFLTATAQANGPPGGDSKLSSYKIAIDPVNANVAYCGMPAASGNSAGVYTTLNQSGGSTLATWTSVKTSGSTPIPATSYGISCGIIIDPSMGTTTVGGQTVTKHIILPVGGGGIYESTNGGVTFTEIAASAFGVSTFFITSAGYNFDGVYYCIAVQPSLNVFLSGVSWTTSTATITSMPANPGVNPGMTVFDATTSQTIGTVLSWVGSTLTLTANALHASSGSNDTLTFSPPASPDVRGIWRYVSGSPGTWTNITGGSYPTNNFTVGVALIVDRRNIPASKTYLSVFGPQGIGAGYTATNANTASAGTINWAGYTGGMTTFLKAASYDIGYINSIFGQGVSGFNGAATAVIDNNGVCWWPGNQSLFYFGSSSTVPTPTTTGGPVYTGTPGSVYSWSMGRGQEATVAVDALHPPGGPYPILGMHDIGAPVRGTFTTYPLTVAVPFKEYACTSLEYAASDPSFVVARVTAQLANIDASCYSNNYGADGSWTQLSNFPTSLYGTPIEGGSVVAVDHDHWVMVPNGFGAAIQPAYTTNATTTATWTLCNGLPVADWWSEPWFFGGYTPKQFAVGYGADLNTVWACLVSVGNTTATLYRSTDRGANFSSIKTWTISIDAFSSYCLSVPGYPNELWITSRYSGGTNTGLWHITNANTSSPTLVPITLPPLAPIPVAFTLGAPASGGGYPTLYLLSNTGFNTTEYLYQGTYPGSGSTVTWTLVGTSGQPNGIDPDLPVSCQLAGIQSIRGDWNVYQRLYVASHACGYAYYSP